ncbi:MAG: hypothetical protein IS860_09860 [Nitrosopumilus sp.]|nr:hypothetical protein [Nitrosopumilus sp.]
MSGGNRISLMRTVKYRDPLGIGIFQKITQSESQKIDYILPILDYLLENKKFSAIELKQHFHNFNHKSIDRTILLLKKRNLITLEKTELKNKKIYKIISKSKIKQYSDDLIKYRKFKVFFQVSSTKIKALDGLGNLQNYFNNLLIKGQEKSKFFLPLPDNFLIVPLKIKNKSTFVKLGGSPEKWPVSLTVNEMFGLYTIKIMDDYRSGRICYKCFSENKLRYYIAKDEEYLCDFGHLSENNFDDSLEYFENEILDPTKISKKFTDPMLKFQRKNILKNKNIKN